MASSTWYVADHAHQIAATVLTPFQHDRNMIHRDIKPENILLMDDDFTVKIGDFGLAKIVGEESFTTTMCGTPSYVAPEILRSNRNRKYTKAVDIWSLGVVLYICLCGFPPFSDELTGPDFPYTLVDQIREAKYSYPSPYWDPITDAACMYPFGAPFFCCKAAYQSSNSRSHRPHARGRPQPPLHGRPVPGRPMAR
jgi:serine/threonine protein kinase